MTKLQSGSRRIIIVEDDEDLRDSIIKYLRLKDYDVHGVGTALDFYAEVSIHPYAIAILDLALPDQDGLVIAKYIRANTGMRILMLTARTKVEDRLAGYESGADVYLVKPVDFRELAASLDSLFGRLERDSSPAITANKAEKGHWRLNGDDWTLESPEGDLVKMTSKEYQFLYALAEVAGHIVSREELLKILGYALNESSNRSLESLVYRLRKKISTAQEAPIKTASGDGYTFCSAIEIV